MTLLGAAFALTATLALLTGVIRFFAGNTGLWRVELETFSEASVLGFPEDEIPAMAAHIADYLNGRKDSFQFSLTGTNGGPLACFHGYELIHMADCRGLIRLDGIVCAICAGIALAAALMIMIPRSSLVQKRATLNGSILALRVLGILAACFLLWACINFDSLFLTFHRIAFRNDYWLLDPRTDLLIRLMPEGLFIDLGLKGLAVFALVQAVLVTGILMLRNKIISRK